MYEIRGGIPGDSWGQRTGCTKFGSVPAACTANATIDNKKITRVALALSHRQFKVSISEGKTSGF
jgi:hypothetical protein